MPRFLKKVPSGFKVCDVKNPLRCFSKKALSSKQAKKQMIAIQLSELRKQGKIKPRL